MSDYMVTIIIALIGANGFWALLQSITKKLFKKRGDSISDVMKEVDELKADQLLLKELTIAHARDRLNDQCNKFINLGYIPQEDYVSFKLLGEAYLKAGGNSEVGAKFEYCMTKFEVKSTDEVE